tara:strand:+ start:809 stop:1450 length:642 start_codon:yes stop_codon:yes gene_type:complete
MAMATELLCQRWNLIILRELHLGSSNFNTIRKGAPKISPALLSQRLKYLENHKLIFREKETIGTKVNYILTTSGKATFDIISKLGDWGKFWFDESVIIDNSEPQLLMWDLQRNIVLNKLPQRNLIIEINFSLEKKYPNWWIIFKPPSSIDLGHIDLGQDADVVINSSVEALTKLHMGFNNFETLIEVNEIEVLGADDIITSIPDWLGTTHFSV